MWRWWRVKAAAGCAAAALVAALLTGVAGAVNLCTLTGNLTLIDGMAGANAQVFFDTIATQSFGGTVIPPSSFSVFTDANGDLPPGVTLPQGAIVQVTIGSGQPVQIQIPLAATVDLATLILANSDPPSVVSSVAIGAGGDYGLTVTNPSTGAIGAAVLQPGKVTALQGEAFSATPPTDAQLPIFNGGAAQWQPQSISGDASIANSGALSVNGIMAGGNITAKTTGGPFSVFNYNINNEFNPVQYGAKLDTRRVSGLTVNHGSTAVSSSGANFTPADVGKLILIWTGPNGGSSARTFTGTITAVAAPTAVLSAPYGGPDQSNAVAFIGSDDGAAINAAFNAVPSNSSGVVKVPGNVIMTSTTLEINGHSIEFAGQGMGANVTTSGNNGTLIVWAGGNDPVIKVTDSQGSRVHDFIIIGNDQPSGRPSACIDLLDHLLITPSHPPNSFNHIYNIMCGLDLNDPGSGNGNPIATVGIMGDPEGTQNDRNIFDNVRIGSTIYGLQISQSQAVEWDIKDMTCRNTAVCIDSHKGSGDLSIIHLEALNSALVLWLGQGAAVSVSNFANEDDSGISFAPPWTAGEFYPVNFVIEDSNGNMQAVILTDGNGQSKNGSPPNFLTPAQSTSWTISSASRSSNIVSVTTTQNNDFSVGQTVAIVGTADGSYVGTFTIASKPAANQFTYAQSGADSSTSGGNAWHAVLDAQDSANSVTWVAVGTANWARFANFVGHGGTSGGMLSIVDSVYSTGIFQTNLTNWPYNGDIINCGFQSDCGFVGRQFVLTQSTGHPPPNQPRVDLATVGNAARFFKCVGCRGLAADNVSVGVAQGSGTQLTYVDIDNAGVLSIAGAPSPGFGSYYVNALVNGDSAGLDTFRHDIVGKLREFGGPLTVNQLSPPSSVFALSCTTGDTHTYTYEVTAKSGSGETLGSSEASVSSCNAVNVNHPITGRFRPVLGADAYNVYRTAVDGGSGTEKLAVTVAQNSEDGTGAVWSFTDTTTDTNLGAVLPTANTTGNATAGGVLAAGASAAAGAAAGDLSAARDASSGALWLGSNGSQSVDFGITNAGAFSLLGGGLFTPSLSINDAGQLFMGRTTVGSLPTCNTANKFSWLVVTNNNVACAYGNAPAGGGTIACPVFCDGAAWKIH